MSQANIWDRIMKGETVDDLPKVYKFMKRKCMSWDDCLYLAREKFDKYFSHKVLTLKYFTEIFYILFRHVIYYINFLQTWLMIKEVSF